MTLLAQHGHGKGGMIDQGLASSALNGAIFGPTNEDPKRLSDYISAVRKRHPAAVLAVDPQVYVACLPEPKLGHLAEYPYFPKRRPIDPARLNAREVIKLVGTTMSWQQEMLVSYLFTPTMLISTFALDAWTKAALDLAQEACSWQPVSGKKRPVYLSVVVRQDAFRSLEDIREFVDFITGMEPGPAGIYLVIERGEARYSQHIDGMILQNLLWLVHALAGVHRLKVVVGYTDIIGVVLHAVGAEATACGWYHSLRQFSMQRFVPKEGGAQAIPRYTSGPLLDSILLTHALVLDGLTTRAGEKGWALAATKSGVDADLINDPSTSVWPAGQSTQHHWKTVSDLITQVNQHQGAAARIDAAERLINQAAKRWQALKSAGYALGDNSAGTHLQVWQSAIRGFRTEVQL